MGNDVDKIENGKSSKDVPGLSRRSVLKTIAALGLTISFPSVVYGLGGVKGRPKITFFPNISGKWFASEESDFTDCGGNMFTSDYPLQIWQDNNGNIVIIDYYGTEYSGTIDEDICSLEAQYPSEENGFVMVDLTLTILADNRTMVGTANWSCTNRGCLGTSKISCSRGI